MYAAITHLTFQPGRTEEASELFGSMVMPAYAEGVARGAWIFTHAEDNRAIVIVLYSTREEAEVAKEQEAMDEVLKAKGDLLSESPRREVFFVAMGASAATHANEPSCSSLQPLSGDILSLLAEVSRSL